VNVAWPRSVVLLAALVATSVSAAAAPQGAGTGSSGDRPERTASAASMRVTLLGTGTPTPQPDRAGPSTLVEAGGLVLLFDVGRGAVVRLSQSGVRLADVDAVFITHLHSDHFLGLPDLQLSMRMPADYGMRRRPLALYGPTGTVGMARGLETAFARDIEIRARGQNLDPAWSTFEAVEYAQGGVVFERDGVRVTAVEVEHGPEIKPAFGYRVDYRGRSVVISGDTTFDERLIDAARGVDLLIHEVVSIPASYVEQFPGMQRVLAKHTSPEQAGVVFNRARPKLAVYSHLALIGGGTPPQVVAETRRTYAGPLMVGEDLMTFEIGDGIAVYQRSSDQRAP
jgi:ribonuclease Z